MRFFWLALLALYPVSASAERLLDLGEIRFNHNSGSSYNGNFSSAPTSGSDTRYRLSGKAAEYMGGPAMSWQAGGLQDFCPAIGAGQMAQYLATCDPGPTGTACPTGPMNFQASTVDYDRMALREAGTSQWSGSYNCWNWRTPGDPTSAVKISSVTVYFAGCGADQSPKMYMQDDGTCSPTSNGTECPEGSVEQTFVTNGETRSHCGPELNPENQDNCMFNPDGSMFCEGDSGEPEEGCNDPLSIYDGNSICASDKNACTRAGGTFGFVGSGSEMNGICIPFDDAEQIPTCADLSAPVQSSNGSWRCLTSGELDINPNQNNPNTNPSVNPDDLDGDGIPNADDDSPNGGTFVPGRLPSDIDGDGIPDLEDGDMDGDGINNGSDDDADGDGILNEDDPTPDGDLDGGTDDEIEEEEEENEVSGGGTCDSAPTCSGDEAACAVVLQSWETRCAVDELTEEIEETDDGGFSYADSASNDLLDDFETTALDFLSEESGLVAADGLGDSLSTALGFSYSCQDWVFSYQSISASITCADTAPLRTLLSWAFGIFTLIAVFQIATRSPE